MNGYRRYEVVQNLTCSKMSSMGRKLELPRRDLMVLDRRVTHPGLVRSGMISGSSYGLAPVRQSLK